MENKQQNNCLRADSGPSRHTIQNKSISSIPGSGSEICLHFSCTYVTFPVHNLWLWNNQSEASSQFPDGRIDGVRHQPGQRNRALHIVCRLRLIPSLEESQCTFSLSHLKTNEPPPSWINNESKCAEEIMGGSRALVVIDVQEASDLLENSSRGNISEQLVIVRFLCQENTREGLWTH